MAAMRHRSTRGASIMLNRGIRENGAPRRLPIYLAGFSCLDLL